MDERGYLQISFGWIFALLVGGFILALAGFIVIGINNTGNTQLNAETASTIGVSLNALEIGSQGLRKTSMDLPSNSRVLNQCDVFSTFGTQYIGVEQSALGSQGGRAIPLPFAHRYVFSDKVIEAERLFFTVEPFYFPFKVGDIIIMTSRSDSYCFDGAPSVLARNLRGLQENIRLVEDGACASTDTLICFVANEQQAASNCDTVVVYQERTGEGYVKKEGRELHFTQSLLMGAIFAHPDIYECQVKRLMQRVEVLSEVYVTKSHILGAQGCTTNVQGDLALLQASADQLLKSSQLSQLQPLADKIGRDNDANSLCRMW